MWHCAYMPIEVPKPLTQCRDYFLVPKDPRQRQYEAFRAFYADGLPSDTVARRFGYTPASFRVLCHRFRRLRDPDFFVRPRRGPQSQPKKSAALDTIIALRKRNYSVYDISQSLKAEGIPLSVTAVREVLKAEGFARLPRRLDEERLQQPRPTVEKVADARSFLLEPAEFTTACGGLFLFMPDLVRLATQRLADNAHLPGSKMIPAEHALRSCLALKLWSIERKSHIMSLVTDRGLALFAGLNVIPKRSYLSEYSHRIDHVKTLGLLTAWQTSLADTGLVVGESFNLDFHSVPFFGEDPMVERHYVAMRSRRQSSMLVFLAQDATGRSFCYSNADLRKGEENDEIFNFINYWKQVRGGVPKHLVFDSRLTTYKNLNKLNDMGITFITLRRRSASIIKEMANLPRSAWRTIHLDVPTRKFQDPQVFEQKVALGGAAFRQIFIKDLGHNEPTIMLTNDPKSTQTRLITRYAQRMLIENALSDAVRFFHINALSSSVGLKVDFDMALMVLASGLYRMVARRMRGYADAQARQIFRDLIQTPATVTVANDGVTVRLHRRAHLPLIIASGLLNTPVVVPWWNGKRLTMTA
jgi:hypothetical protein